MKKIIFYIPAVLVAIFYGFIAITMGVKSISPFVLVFMGMLFVSAFLLERKRFWGAFFGILPAIYVIYMGTQETGQVVSETPIGIALFLFYTICGVLVFRRAKKDKKEKAAEFKRMNIEDLG